MVFFSVAMDAEEDAARGFAFDFFAPFLEVVFTVQKTRLGQSSGGLVSISTLNGLDEPVLKICAFYRVDT